MENQTLVALYNVEAGLFLAGANDWGTRSSVVKAAQDKGSMNDFLSGNATVSFISWVIAEQDVETVGGETIQCYSFANEGGGVYNVADAWNGIWVDGGTDRAWDKWYVNDLGGNTFQLSYLFSDGTNRFKMPGWFGAQQLAEGDTKTYIMEGENTTWALVAQEDADELISDLTFYQHQMSVYRLQASLYSLIVKAKNGGLTVSAEYEALASADIAGTTTAMATQRVELDKAVADMKKQTDALPVVVDWSSATLGAPVDVTEVIPNVVDGTLSLDAWTNFNLNTWSTESDPTTMRIPFLEYWRSKEDKMPLVDNKLYRDQNKVPFTVQPGAYRISANVRIYNESGADYMTGAYLFGNLNRSNLVKPDVDGQANALEGAVYGNYSGMLYYWKDGFDTYAIVPADGLFQFGAQVEGANFNWFAAKGWKVEYLGAAFDALDYVRQNTELVVSDDDLEGVDLVTKALREEYEKTEQYVSTYKAATKAEDILAAYGGLFSTREQLPANIAAWAKYDALAAEILGDQSIMNPTCDEATTLCDYLNEDTEPSDDYNKKGSYKYILDALTLTTKEVEEETAWLEALYTEAIKKSMTPGQDVSSMLVNASFADGFTGWDMPNTVNRQRGGLNSFPVVEVFEAAVDISQVVENVPDGIYSITCRAFERPAYNGQYSGKEKSLVYLYMNDFRTPVQNIIADKIAAEDAEDLVNAYINGGDPKEPYIAAGGDTGADAKLMYDETRPYDDTDYYYSETTADNVEFYVPNGTNGASIAFKAGRYEQKVYGLVEGGTMKVGLTSDGNAGPGGHWVLWSNFKFTYEGKTAKAIKEVIDMLYEKAQEYIGSVTPGEDISNGAYNEVRNAALLARAASSYQNEADADVDKMWDALKALNEVLLRVDENAPVFAEYQTYVEMLDDVYYEIGVTTEEQDKAYDNIQMEISKADGMTTPELKVLIEKIKDVMAFLRLPADVDSASDSNPIPMNVIINPSFEEGDITGWTATAFTDDTGAREIYESDGETESVYFIELADGDYVFNTWSGGAVAGGYFLQQTVKSLPAGTYKLEAALASDAGNTINLCINDKKVAYEIPEVVADDEDADDSEADEDEDDEDAEPVVKHEAKNIGIEAEHVYVLAEGDEFVIRVESDTWFKADNFRLTYYGKDSKLEPSEIEGVESEAGAPAAIYTVAGAKVASLQKGINIVKYANGKVVKVLVK